MFAAAGCSNPRHGAHSLAAIKKRGTLIVLTRNAPTTYYIGHAGRPTGPEYQMVLAFAKFIGVRPKFVVENSTPALLKALANGRGDIVAAGITRTRARKQRFDFGPRYQEVTQEVVCRRHGPRPKKLSELASVHLKVIADSSYAGRLRSLRQKYSKLAWKTTDTQSTQDLLKQVWTGKLDCTVADSNILAINRRYFPDLVAALKISKPQPLAWALPKAGSAQLRAAMRRWMSHYKTSGALHVLMMRYYGHIHIFNGLMLHAFARKIKTVWPHYRDVFYLAGRKSGISPLILAALAWQESHWNPHARGPSGAVGMMMLTLSTAHAFGVANRLDVVQSVHGGARYLAHLEKKLDGKIPANERIWFALAAYNIGLYHLRDARQLAKKLGRDPNSWYSVSHVLPLLAEKRYYRHLRYGYARGFAPVRYVRRIRNYADILRAKNQM
jgi:membrane-bound lytic murein transglycosylase F